MVNMEKTHEKLTQAPLSRLLIELCLPTILAALLPPLLAIWETWLAAKIDANACGAMGIVFPVHALIQTIGFVFGTGASSLVANALGKKEKEKAGHLAFGALFFALLFSGFLMIFGLCFQAPMLFFLGTNGDILPFARPYAICLLAAAPLMCLCFVLSNLLRAEGKTIFAMVGLAVGNLISVLVSILLVFGLKAGIVGIGLSISLGYGLSFLILSYPYWKRKTLVSVKPVFGIKLFLAAKSTAINGLPSLFRQGLTVVAVILLNRAAGKFGTSAITAVAVSSRIFLLFYAIPLGIGQGMVPAVGFNYGNGDIVRTKRIYRLCIAVATLLLAVLSLPTAIFAKTVLQWFWYGEDMLPFGVPLLRSLCIVLPLHGLIAVTNLLLQALKRPVAASILAAARQGIFFLPLIFLLPSLFSFTGVWLTQPLADVFTFFLALFYAIRFIAPNSKKRLK